MIELTDGEIRAVSNYRSVRQRKAKIALWAGPGILLFSLVVMMLLSRLVDYWYEQYWPIILWAVIIIGSLVASCVFLERYQRAAYKQLKKEYDVRTNG